MSRTHTVAEGESLYRIAKLHGIASWRDIYDHPDNAALRTRRPDPHVLYPGDEVVIPDDTSEATAVSLNRATTLVLRRRDYQPLRVVLRDADDQPLARVPFLVSWHDGATEGSTDADGALHCEVPAEALEVRMTLGDEEHVLHVGRLNPLDDTDDDGASGAQARLRNLGYDPGLVDGILGPLTEAALGDFQIDHGLEVTEQLDPETRRELSRRHGA